MRLRVTYTKDEAIKYISHLDMVRLNDRAIRRSGIPIGYSQGFNPHPLIAYGPPLPVGVSSCAEVLDITLKQAMTPSIVAQQLQRTVAPGVSILSVESVDDRAPALTEFINQAEYEAHFEEADRARLAESIARLMGETNMPLTRLKKGQLRTDDVRPSILALTIQPDKPILSMRLRIGQTGNLKPMDVSTLLPDISLTHYRRTALSRSAAVL
jgi:radical SAM-linked protein